MSLDAFLDYLDASIKRASAELEALPPSRASGPAAVALDELVQELRSCVLHVGYFQSLSPADGGMGGVPPMVDLA